jgi:hypothetical protein
LEDGCPTEDWAEIRIAGLALGSGIQFLAVLLVGKDDHDEVGFCGKMGVSPDGYQSTPPISQKIIYLDIAILVLPFRSVLVYSSQPGIA